MCTKFKIVFMAALFCACASIQDLPDIGMQLSHHQIAIINQTDTVRHFFIGEEPGNLDEVKIGAGETWISHSYPGKPYIKVIHEQGFEEYFLMPGLLYNLYIDHRKKHPDIKMYRKRQR